ncbi:hypothetical protein, partial [Salmonella enterica]|uniref:hypothetical protein n=1 Tax=Salmonella enterica TaxID=28901 RepID=UPI003296C7B9
SREVFRGAFPGARFLFIIFLFMTNSQTSYPRAKIKILLLENISEAAVKQFAAGGYTQTERASGALAESDLIEAVRG